VRKDILNHLREDGECLTTTMVDYYGLPQEAERAWPGRSAANSVPFEMKASTVEEALAADIREEIGSSNRFIPFVMMHEFEGLLFSDPDGFARGIGRDALAPQLKAVRDQFATPEHINDSPVTAPSKRVKALVPDYQKPLLGTLAVIEIGLDAIRRECPQFRGWLNRLEAWCDQ